jgi:hypothetical protein
MAALAAIEVCNEYFAWVLIALFVYWLILLPALAASCYRLAFKIRIRITIRVTLLFEVGCSCCLHLY